MVIYSKLAITLTAFTFFMWLISYPKTAYVKWFEKKLGWNYLNILMFSMGLGLIPLFILGLYYLWFVA